MLIEPQLSELNNKLKILALPMKGVKSATVLLLIKAGSRYETKKLNGIAHFAEHMFFKGTGKRPTALEITSLIDGLGAEFNAFTSKEYTGFYIKAASSHLELVTEVLSDMLLHSKFDSAEINRERGVINEELRMYLDTPMRHVGDIFEELLYGDQPLGWDTVGTLESLENIKREDFLTYNSKYYLGPNMMFIIGGEVSSQKAKALAGKYFIDLPNKPSPEFKKVAFEQTKPAVKVFYKDSQQAHFCLGVRSFALGNPNRYKLAVLNTILGSSMSSRLFIQLRERRGLAYYVRSGVEEYHDTGSFVAQAGVEPTNTSEAIKVILNELAKIAVEEPTEEELTKAKESIKGRLVLELEDSREVSTIFGLQQLLENKMRTPEEIIAQIDKVQARDVSRVAKEIFLDSKLNLGIIGPFKSEEKFIKELKF